MTDIVALLARNFLSCITLVELSNIASLTKANYLILQVTLVVIYTAFKIYTDNCSTRFLSYKDISVLFD